MKTGINQWAFPPDWTTEAAMKSAKGIGFASFEICVGEDGPVSIDATENEIANLRSTAKQLGLEVSSVASGMGWQYPLSSPDPQLREQGKTAVAKELQIAQWLGADAVLVVPGVVTPEVAYDTALENTLAAIEDLLPVAEKLQVAIAVENVWNKFLVSPVEMRDFIDQFDSPYVRAFFDIGNIMLYGFPEQWIRILGRRIAKVHAKDFRTNVGNLDGFVMLMEGEVDWPAVVTALHEVGYTGPLTAEYGPYPHSLETMLRHAHSSLEAIIALGA